VDLDQRPEPHILEVLRHTLEDPRQPVEVRLNVLKRLRGARLDSEQRKKVARTMLDLLGDRSRPDLRLQAVVALAEFADVGGVPSALGSLALDAHEPIDVRYSAFTSLQRAGPTTECIALLRQLLTDEALGRATRSLLSSWRLE
jgi:hypothetical protein